MSQTLFDMANDLVMAQVEAHRLSPVLSQSSIFGAKSKNRVSEIQRLTDCQTLEKATLRQNRLNCLKYDELLTRFCQLVDHPF